MRNDDAGSVTGTMRNENQEMDNAAPSGNGDGAAAVRGRESVRQALLDSATRLFAERGPRAVSVRDIAADAGVHYTLIYRHFGSRNELVREVFARMSEELRVSLAGKDEDRLARITDALAERPFIWRLVVQGLLDSETGLFADREHRYTRDMLEAVQRSQASGEIDPELDPTLVTTMGLALAMGWLLLEEQLKYLPVSRGRSVEQLRAAARDTWWNILKPSAAKQ